MSDITGFSPIVNKHAQLLILGSMPSTVSLRKQEYYGHERNAFWPIMLSLFNRDKDFKIADYRQRKLLLIKNHIAVWDVLQSSVIEQEVLIRQLSWIQLKRMIFSIFFLPILGLEKYVLTVPKLKTFISNMYCLM